MTKTPVIKTEDLTIRFGGHIAVNAVSCEFYSGTLTAIVGPNGAGKTTYFNLISGQLPPSSGKAFLNGKDITNMSVPEKMHAGIGRAFQLTNLFPRLTVHENVRLAVQSKARITLDLFRVASARRNLIEKADEYLAMCQLENRRDEMAASLPHGDQRKLEVAVLLALEPEVFMFDEPTAGMSVDDVPVILNLIEDIKHRGNKTVLLVEHKMDVIRSLADRIIVLHNGELVADGEPAEVIASPIVQQAYLGVTPEDE